MNAGRPDRRRRTVSSSVVGDGRNQRHLTAGANDTVRGSVASVLASPTVGAPRRHRLVASLLACSSAVVGARRRPQHPVRPLLKSRWRTNITRRREHQWQAAQGERTPLAVCGCQPQLRWRVTARLHVPGGRRHVPGEGYQAVCPHCRRVAASLPCRVRWVIAFTSMACAWARG